MTLLEKATDSKLTGESFGAILDALLDHESEAAIVLALEAISSRDESPNLHERAIEAARSLVMHGRASEWDSVWHAVLRTQTSAGRSS